MEFENEAQERSYGKVKQYMQEIYGEQYGADDDDPAFMVSAGSSRVLINVLAWGDTNSVVQVGALVTSGTELTADLMKWLLDKNGEVLFGAFQLFGEGDIVFGTSVLADNLDKDELRTAIDVVGWTADKFDDEIMSRWGGQRLQDLWDKKA